MNCKTIQEQLPDVALGTAELTPELEHHLDQCRGCHTTLQALQATMKLLDDWKVPEPSPYWDVRFQARLRAAAQPDQPSGWFAWLRRPALSLTAALCLVAGITGYQLMRLTAPVAPPPAPVVTASAADDLQFLDKNQDLISSLADLDGDDDGSN